MRNLVQKSHKKKETSNDSYDNWFFVHIFLKKKIVIIVNTNADAWDYNILSIMSHNG